MRQPSPALALLSMLGVVAGQPAAQTPTGPAVPQPGQVVYALFDQKIPGSPTHHVRGYISFDQRSGGPTYVHAKLTGLPKSVSQDTIEGVGFSWQVHQWPKSGAGCGKQSIGDLFRPEPRAAGACSTLARVSSCPPAAGSTTAGMAVGSAPSAPPPPLSLVQVCNQTAGVAAMDVQQNCDVGDLSGKHGLLHPQFATGASTGDVDVIFKEESVPAHLGLSLEGLHSIVGRSVLLSYKATTARTGVAIGDAVPLMCATISYTAPVVQALVEFQGAVEGSVLLKQAENNPSEDTSIFVRLSKASGATTSGHHLKIHTGLCASSTAPSGPVWSVDQQLDGHLTTPQAQACRQTQGQACEKHAPVKIHGKGSTGPAAWCTCPDARPCAWPSDAWILAANQPPATFPSSFPFVRAPTAPDPPDTMFQAANPLGSVCQGFGTTSSNQQDTWKCQTAEDMKLFPDCVLPGATRSTPQADYSRVQSCTPKQQSVQPQCVPRNSHGECDWATVQLASCTYGRYTTDTSHTRACETRNVQRQDCTRTSAQSNTADRCETEDCQSSWAFWSNQKVPLTGGNAVLGMSLVVYNAAESTVPIACANIPPRPKGEEVDHAHEAMIRDTIGTNSQSVRVHLALRVIWEDLMAGSSQCDTYLSSWCQERASMVFEEGPIADTGWPSSLRYHSSCLGLNKFDQCSLSHRAPSLSITSSEYDAEGGMPCFTQFAQGTAATDSGQVHPSTNAVATVNNVLPQCPATGTGPTTTTCCRCASTQSSNTANRQFFGEGRPSPTVDSLGQPITATQGAARERLAFCLKDVQRDLGAIIDLMQNHAGSPAATTNCPICTTETAQRRITQVTAGRVRSLPADIFPREVVDNTYIAFTVLPSPSIGNPGGKEMTAAEIVDQLLPFLRSKNYASGTMSLEPMCYAGGSNYKCSDRSESEFHWSTPHPELNGNFKYSDIQQPRNKLVLGHPLNKIYDGELVSNVQTVSSLHTQGSCKFGATFPGTITGCCCGCPAFEHQEVAEAFCASNQANCGGVSQIGNAWFPRRRTFQALGDVKVYTHYAVDSQVLGTLAGLQYANVLVEALQGVADSEGTLTWIQMRLGWIPIVRPEDSTTQLKRVIHYDVSNDKNGLTHGSSSALLSCSSSAVCMDTCSTAADGFCDDPSGPLDHPGCASGTDCSDCGMAPAKASCTDTCSRCIKVCKSLNNSGVEHLCGDSRCSNAPCTDSCTPLSNDGTCDSTGRPDQLCEFGTDCSDCDTRVRARVVLAMDIASIPVSGNRSTFVVQFIADVATLLDVPQSRVSVLAVTPGSVIISFVVQPNSAGQKYPPSMLDTKFAARNQPAGLRLGGALVAADTSQGVGFRLETSTETPAPCANFRPDHSQTLCRGISGNICLFVCDQGYRKSSGDLVCMVDGTYRGGGCAPKQCEALEVPNGQLEMSNADGRRATCTGRTGDKCVFACDIGYEQAGTMECAVDGKFRGGYCREIEFSYKTWLLLGCAVLVVVGGFCVCFFQWDRQRRLKLTKLSQAELKMRSYMPWLYGPAADTGPAAEGEAAAPEQQLVPDSAVDSAPALPSVDEELIVQEAKEGGVTMRP
jgi:hypothetical protein